MSTSTNNGAQVVTLAYKAVESSKNVNRLVSGMLPTGIYTDVSFLTTATPNVVSLNATDGSKWVAFFYDDNFDVGIKCEFTATATGIGTTHTRPWMVLRYNWVDSSNMYAEIRAVSWSTNPLTETDSTKIMKRDLILGCGVFDISNNVVSFDYALQSRAYSTELQTAHSAFKVRPSYDTSGIPTSKVYINGGTVDINGTLYTKTAGEWSVAVPAVSTPGFGRIDFVYINTSGVYTLQQGIEGASPSAPATPDGVVLAKINRPAATPAATVVITSDITQYYVDRRYIANPDLVLTGLNTTATTIKGAINELQGEFKSTAGTAPLSGLTTTAKTSLVDALNENVTSIATTAALIPKNYAKVSRIKRLGTGDAGAKNMLLGGNFNSVADASLWTLVTFTYGGSNIAGAGGTASQVVSTAVQGRKYVLQFTVGTNGYQFQVSFGGVNQFVSTVAATGTFSCILESVTGGDTLQLSFASGSGSMTLDSVSLVEAGITAVATSNLLSPYYDDGVAGNPSSGVLLAGGTCTSYIPARWAATANFGTANISYDTNRIKLASTPGTINTLVIPFPEARAGAAYTLVWTATGAQAAGTVAIGGGTPVAFLSGAATKTVSDIVAGSSTVTAVGGTYAGKTYPCIVITWQDNNGNISAYVDTFLLTSPTAASTVQIDAPFGIMLRNHTDTANTYARLSSTKYVTDTSSASSINYMYCKLDTDDTTLLFYFTAVAPTYSSTYGYWYDSALGIVGAGRYLGLPLRKTTTTFDQFIATGKGCNLIEWKVWSAVYSVLVATAITSVQVPIDMSAYIPLLTVSNITEVALRIAAINTNATTSLLVYLQSYYPTDGSAVEELAALYGGCHASLPQNAGMNVRIPYNSNKMSLMLSTGTVATGAAAVLHGATYSI